MAINSKPKKTPPPSNPVIREMSLSDLPAVYALGETLFPADKWPALYRTWDEYELAVHFASDSETCLVAELDERVVGFALGTLLEKRGSAWTYGYLLWLGVDETMKRQGVAARLFERITELFIKLGARMIMVDTDAENEAALNFFRSQGFGQETPHLFLSRNLSHDPDYLRHRRGPTRASAKRRKPAPSSRPNYAPGRGGDD
ncbi:MAG: GNAT family N-acetyltransferase [Holophaga sp.]|jgi:ribosomal protein S18 acetylase RimI-like enzyme